jgi:hypothetical protein
VEADPPAMPLCGAAAPTQLLRASEEQERSGTSMLS